MFCIVWFLAGHEVTAQQVSPGLKYARETLPFEQAFFGIG